MGRRDEEQEHDETQDASEQLVPQDLTEDEIRERQLAIANKTVELFDLEEKRAKQVKRANLRIKELKADLRALATEVRTKVKMVPAQLRFADAVQSRRSVERGTQDRGKAVGA